MPRQTHRTYSRPYQFAICHVSWDLNSAGCSYGVPRNSCGQVRKKAKTSAINYRISRAAGAEHQIRAFAKETKGKRKGNWRSMRRIKRRERTKRAYIRRRMHVSVKGVGKKRWMVKRERRGCKKNRRGDSRRGSPSFFSSTLRFSSSLVLPILHLFLLLFHRPISVLHARLIL